MPCFCIVFRHGKVKSRTKKKTICKLLRIHSKHISNLYVVHFTCSSWKTITRVRFRKKKYRIPLHRFVCLIDLLLYVHGKQLRPCRDGQILNHTVPVQASEKWYVAPILLPVINNLLFSNQQRKNDDIGTVLRLNIDLNLILKLVTDCTAPGGGACWSTVYRCVNKGHIDTPFLCVQSKSNPFQYIKSIPLLSNFCNLL